ncbi:MAG TPA: DUF4893 domain-containing protein [Caulobacteraceae bacterium]|nr:DUF4893 domain-containing protein [Caulobacteraceae bacterium]
MTWKAALFAALALAACRQEPQETRAHHDPAAPGTPPPPMKMEPGARAPARAPAQATDDWRDYAKPGDVDRLARLDAAWAAGLKGVAESDSDKAREDLAALGPVGDPEATVLPNPHPAPGDYRCRTMKLGGMGMISYGWFRCRVELSPGGDLTLTKVTGSQRQQGKLYPDPENPNRLIFLGTVAWGAWETDYPAYGSDPQRDVVGVLERVGEQRWRLVLPWPRVESDLDILEIAR